MTILPIVDRELRVASRRATTYWLRCLAATAALALGWLAFQTRQGAGPTETGLRIFVTLGILTFLISVFAGVLMTADCLAEERREGTLGLLFLTGLKTYDVVLGKLVSNSLHAVFGLVAVFPILGVPLAMGGVTGGEFARLILVFCCTLFCSLNLGLLVSACSHDARQALTRGILFMFVLAGVFPMLDQAVTAYAGAFSYDFIFWPSPACAFYYGFDHQYRTANGPLNFWISLALTALFSVVFLLWANFALPRASRETNAEAARPTRWLRHIRPRSGFIAFMRGRVQGDNPVYWLAMGDDTGRRQLKRAFRWLQPVWFILLLSALFSPLHVQMYIACMALTYCLHLVVKVLFAAEASQQMFGDRQSGALELLLATPISVEEIVEGHRQALKEHFRSAFFKLCRMNLYVAWLAVAFSSVLDINGDDWMVFLEVFAGGVLLLWMDLRALAYVGMWRGLNSRRPYRAVLTALAQLMLIPWLAMFIIVSADMLNTAVQAALLFAVWVVASIAVDYFFGGMARWKLLKTLRAAAANRFQPAR